MKLVDTFLQHFKKSRITVSIAITNANESQISQNNSYSLILVDIKKEGNIPTAILLTNGENMAAESTMTMKLPRDSTIDSLPNGISFVYKSENKTVKVSLTGHPIVTNQPNTEVSTKATQLFQNERPTVKEIKDSQGNVTKITLQTPQNYQEQEYYEQIKHLVATFLNDWRVLSLAKKRAGTATWLYKNIKFEQISTVFLPGDTFFQISGYDGKELITIDLSTSMTISVLNKSILFDFDDISYELVQGDKSAIR